MKIIRNTIAFLLYAFSLTAFGAADYASIKSSVGMSKDEMKATFGRPELATDTTWMYSTVIHPDTGKPSTCLVRFDSDLKVESVRC